MSVRAASVTGAVRQAGGAVNRTRDRSPGTSGDASMAEPPRLVFDEHGVATPGRSGQRRQDPLRRHDPPGRGGAWRVRVTVKLLACAAVLLLVAMLLTHPPGR
jgi:hypothetical protein